MLLKSINDSIWCDSNISQIPGDWKVNPYFKILKIYFLIKIFTRNQIMNILKYEVTF